MNDKKPEKQYILITSFGTDRPGIVEDLSGWILECGGNIEDSRMSLLGGEFASLILVSGDEQTPRKLEGSITEFQDSRNLTVFLKPVSGEPLRAERAVMRYYLQAASLDHPGIVHKVAGILHRHEINIISAQTHTVSAPFSGSLAFHLDMEIDIPGEVSINRLREDLHELGDEENIDIELSAE